MERPLPSSLSSVATLRPRCVTQQSSRCEVLVPPPSSSSCDRFLRCSGSAHFHPLTSALRAANQRRSTSAITAHSKRTHITLARLWTSVFTRPPSPASTTSAVPAFNLCRHSSTTLVIRLLPPGSSSLCSSRASNRYDGPPASHVRARHLLVCLRLLRHKSARLHSMPCCIRLSLLAHTMPLRRVCFRDSAAVVVYVMAEYIPRKYRLFHWIVCLINGQLAAASGTTSAAS